MNIEKFQPSIGMRKSLLACVVCLVGLVMMGSPFAEEVDGGDMRFFVASSGSGAMLSGASSYASCEGGELPLGKTDGHGTVLVSKELLQMKKCYALLFCKKYHFCGAIRTEEKNFYEFEEMYIELAPFAVR